LHCVYISEVERATKAISVEVLWKISKALRVSISRLLRAV
jgi:transcriptional regulator with XRE-family HTH domain